MEYRPKRPTGKPSKEYLELEKEHIRDFTKFRYKQYPQYIEKSGEVKRLEDIKGIYCDIQGKRTRLPKGK